MGRFGIRPCSIKAEKAVSYLDIHTHKKERHNRCAIFNNNAPHTSEGAVSLGLHPWDIDDKWQERIRDIAVAAKAGNVALIGECGIDRINSPASIEMQEAVFIEHIAISEELQKPLLIHCVKAIENIIALHKQKKPAQAWIIHGFRGKPQQAAALARQGFCLSLGEHFNSETAKAIPPEKLFIESDESDKSIEEIYAAIAKARGCTPQELAKQTRENATRCGIEF